ncbi:hypothetical protein [Streptomyces sp. NPDC001401]|uniref:hypothetical protein n=1 Tax=Streptomyces sp. NPDC001401 TaxID=3364570 RepID=UPI0036BF682D
MRYVSAATPHDMEIFLSEIAAEFSRVGAQVYIDLYTDESIIDEQARQALQQLSEIATRNQEKPHRWRLIKRHDPLMGVELDLTRNEHVAYFSRLAHRVINTEVWHADRQLFGTIESYVRVWVDLPDEALQRALAAARTNGASLTAEPQL